MKSNNSSTDLDVVFSEYYIHLSNGFSGSYSKSKNEQFVIAWKDGHFEATETDTDDEIDIEEMERDLMRYRKVIEDGGNPEWKERFLKAVEEKIYKEKYDDWRMAFYNVIKNEIPESNWDEWYDRFTKAIIEDIDKAAEDAIRKFENMSKAEVEESMHIATEDMAETDGELETDDLTWQKGEVILLQGQRVIFTERFDRPFIGRVANNGTFIIDDEMVGEDLQSTLWAYKVSGQKLIQHQFSANMTTLDISEDGRYAICQLASSQTDDRSTIALFDLELGKLLWQKIPETWVADSFEFTSKEEVIYLIYENDTKYKYSITGQFLDRDKWYEHLKKQGTGFQLMEIADKLIPDRNISSDGNQISEALNLYSIAAERLKNNPYFCAQVYRKIGEIYENLGDSIKAIKNYELALRCNPNVGVKKKLQALKAVRK
jgi:tetratricopeptide (TPR) repeat protein